MTFREFLGWLILTIALLVALAIGLLAAGGLP